MIGRNEKFVKKLIAILVFGVLLGGSLAFAGFDSMVDSNWQSYARVSGVSGNINSIGSVSYTHLTLPTKA